MKSKNARNSDTQSTTSVSDTIRDANNILFDESLMDNTVFEDSTSANMPGVNVSSTAPIDLTDPTDPTTH